MGLIRSCRNFRSVVLLQSSFHSPKYHPPYSRHRSFLALPLIVLCIVATSSSFVQYPVPPTYSLLFAAPDLSRPTWPFNHLRCSILSISVVPSVDIGEERRGEERRGEERRGEERRGEERRGEERRGETLNIEPGHTSEESEDMVEMGENMA